MPSTETASTVDRRGARLQLGLTAAIALGAYVLDSKLIFIVAALCAVSAVVLGSARSPGAQLFGRLAAKRLGDEQVEPAGRFRVGELVVAALVVLGVLIVLVSADFKRLGLALVQVGSFICLLGLIADIHLGALQELRRHHIVATAPPEEESDVADDDVIEVEIEADDLVDETQAAE